MQLVCGVFSRTDASCGLTGSRNEPHRKPGSAGAERWNYLQQFVQDVCGVFSRPGVLGQCRQQEGGAPKARQCWGRALEPSTAMTAIERSAATRSLNSKRSLVMMRDTTTQVMRFAGIHTGRQSQSVAWGVVGPQTHAHTSMQASRPKQADVQLMSDSRPRRAYRAWRRVRGRRCLGRPERSPSSTARSTGAQSSRRSTCRTAAR